MPFTDPNPASFTPINIFAMIRALVNNGTPIVNYAGIPVNGTSGTFAGTAGPGAILLDYTNGGAYLNTGTLLSPVWTGIAGPLAGPSVTQAAVGTIASADITGTAAGQLGHAQGVIMVPAAPAGFINELIATIVSYTFAVAAYTAGGNVTTNISGGGVALTGLVANTVLIQAAANVIIEFVPLAATKNTYTAANGLALVSSVAPTNPGTAAGTMKYTCLYRRVALT